MRIAALPSPFLFLGSKAGGGHAAMVYTVLETAEPSGLDSETYLPKAPPLRTKFTFFAEIKIDRCHFADICVL